MVVHQIAWYIAGPVVGLCVVAVRLLFNARLGVTGGFAELIEKAGRGRLDFDWRGWFAIGVLLGGTLFAVVAGGANFSGYGWLTDTFDGGTRWLIAPILVASGALIGYGARLSGGCTSGNGLSGVSSLSAASLAATATFFATAIGVTALIEALI
jgi:uncharacterized membrane protein YedE/YeeE